MSVRLLCNQEVTVRRVIFAADAHYNDAEPAAGPPVTAIYRARLSLTDSVEVLVGADRVTSEWLLELPPPDELEIPGGFGGDAILPTDEVVDDQGRVFAVVGAPNFERGRRGISHIDARLRFVQGG